MLDEEERGTRRKEGRGGRRDEESEKMKIEKVARGCIIGLAGPCSMVIADNLAWLGTAALTNSSFIMLGLFKIVYLIQRTTVLLNLIVK